MLLFDMARDIRKVFAVKMYQPAAAKTFQMEMAAALLFIFDILIAGAGLSVESILADKPLFNKSVELSVASCNSHRRALS